MRSKIKLVYNSGVKNGISNEFSNLKNKKIQILNTYSIIWVHLAIFFVFVDFLQSGLVEYFNEGNMTFRYFRKDAFLGQFITIILMYLVLLLNKNKRFGIARDLFIITAIINFSVFTLFIDPGKYIEYYFVFVSGMALSIYTKNTIPFMIMILSFVIFLTPYYFYVVYPKDYVDRLLVPAAFCIFLSIYLLVNYFKKLNLNNERLLEIEKDKVLSDKVILENQQRKLKELSEFKSHFFVNLSHEIRTPLTLIQGYASRIDLEDSKEKNHEHIRIINSQAEQIQSIIDNIMDLSKMDTSQFHLNTSWVVLSIFFKKHYANFKGLFESKQIDFQLYNTTQKLALSIDEDLFSKSINNLLNNALKFTPKYGEVTLSIFTAGKNVVIELSDTGIGIPEIDIIRVFDRFYQSKNHITKSQGSGIGLSFTKSIIENHGFSIELESEPNVKTTFKLIIPEEAVQEIDFVKVVEYPCIPELEYSIKKDNIQAESSLINPKILVVDDHEQMRSYVSSVLSEYYVAEAANGKEALELMKNKEFDLIITDYMMPVMDGEAFVNDLKNNGIKIPVLVLTARTDNSGKLNMLRLGIDGYLNKPFLEEELLISVKKALKSFDVINKFDSKLNKEEKQELNKFSNKFNEELKAYISENLTSNNLCVEDIAVHFKISKSTLNRKMKSLLGQTAQQLIMEVRFEKARILKEENPYETQKNIAQSIGITNTTYFFKKMEERFGKCLSQ